MFFYILLSWQVLSGIFCSIILMFFAEDLVALPETMAFGAVGFGATDCHS